MSTTTPSHLQRVAIGVLTALLGVAGCGGEPPAPAEPSASGGSGTLGSGGTAGSVPSSGGSKGRPDPSVWYASFVAQTEPGQSPSLVYFRNDTKFIMSLWLGQATFVAVPSGETLGPQFAASVAVATDTTTGQHKDNACVRLPIAKVVGPSKLVPGLAYTVSIALDETLGFVATLTEVPTVPFVAVRAEVLDRTSDAFKPSRLVLDMRGDREAHPVRFTTYDEGTTIYEHAGPEQFTADLSFFAGNGDRFVGSEPVTAGGTPGFTVVVAEAPVDRAAAVVALNKAAD